MKIHRELLHMFRPECDNKRIPERWSPRLFGDDYNGCIIELVGHKYKADEVLIAITHLDNDIIVHTSFYKEPIPHSTLCVDTLTGKGVLLNNRSGRVSPISFRKTITLLDIITFVRENMTSPETNLTQLCCYIEKTIKDAKI